MQQEYNKAASSVANVPPIWLFATAAACIVPVALVYCYSRDLLSAKAGKGGGRVEREGPELEIAEIYVYPIKSLRAIKLSSAIATSHGFAHDRTFMLLEKTPEGYKNMAVSTCPHMTQFLQEISSSTDASPEDRKITVQYLACGDTTRQTTISIPLEPNTKDLTTMPVTMHDSPTTAFRMPDEYSNWFSTCFGFDVILVYLGPNRRSPLFQEMLPSSSPSSSLLPTNLWSPPKKPMGKDKLTFADCAPYLFCTSASLQNVSSRLGPTVPQMDVTKFRPNVVLSFRNNKDKDKEEEDQQPWQEDFWSTIQINNKTNVLFVHNCVRCKSINIDYETGKPGTGPKGEVLKRMQGDRRVDTGARWSPVFGRYAFWENDEEEDAVWRVGDKVKVTRVNEERTVWSWPGLG